MQIQQVILTGFKQRLTGDLVDGTVAALNSLSFFISLLRSLSISLSLSQTHFLTCTNTLSHYLNPIRPNKHKHLGCDWVVLDRTEDGAGDDTERFYELFSHEYGQYFVRMIALFRHNVLDLILSFHLITLSITTSADSNKASSAAAASPISSTVSICRRTVINAQKTH
jgi:hypothetical protein